jgi:predicted DNA-binding protein (MmcQ/YjbR family)
VNSEQFRDYCLAKQAVTESTPFDDVTLVFKVAGKMFALMSLDDERMGVNLKNLPEKNIELREEHDFIVAGYHMNKQHWNTVYMASCFSDQLMKVLIDDSYDLVVKGLPKKDKIAFGFQ